MPFVCARFKKELKKRKIPLDDYTVSGRHRKGICICSSSTCCTAHEVPGCVGLCLLVSIPPVPLVVYPKRYSLLAAFRFFAEYDGLKFYDKEEGRGKEIKAGDTVLVSPPPPTHTHIFTSTQASMVSWAL